MNCDDMVIGFMEKGNKMCASFIALLYGHVDGQTFCANIGKLIPRIRSKQLYTIICKD